MALGPTIHKCVLAVSDTDRNYFETLNLTVARHPSESAERMMVRVFAFCLHAGENLAFTRGLSTPDEPDIWQRSLDDQLLLWIDIGEPAVERIRKATHLANRVVVYSFNPKSKVWWEQVRDKFAALEVQVFQLPWPEVQALATLADRRMELSVNISENTAYVSSDAAHCQLSWRQLN